MEDSLKGCICEMGHILKIEPVGKEALLILDAGNADVVIIDLSNSTIISVMEGIDFIVSDWNMPKMSGLELLKSVRGDEEFKSIPFLMVTAEALKENIIAAIQSGATDYIVEPFNAKTLEAKTKKIFP